MSWTGSAAIAQHHHDYFVGHGLVERRFDSGPMTERLPTDHGGGEGVPSRAGTRGAGSAVRERGHGPHGRRARVSRLAITRMPRDGRGAVGKAGGVYSLVSASVLACDLSRHPTGAAVADVVDRVLALGAEDLGEPAPAVTLALAARKPLLANSESCRAISTRRSAATAEI